MLLALWQESGEKNVGHATRVRPFDLLYPSTVYIKRKMMTHVQREKTKLLNRLRRIRGQIDALERAVTGDSECTRILQQSTACRGALEGFIAEVIEDHIREHLIDPTLGPDSARTLAAEELVGIVHSYLT